MEVSEIIALAAILVTLVNAVIVVLKLQRRAKNNRKNDGILIAAIGKNM